MTPNLSRPSLCDSCTHSHIFKGESPSQDRTYCHWAHPPVVMRHKITACNQHMNKDHTSVRAMEELAYIITKDHVTKKVGFVKLSDIRDKDKSNV